jgi:pimeloyl-ACP methyl ester carboxylesterase
MARIVLVHGASHGAWCWDLVVPPLAACGHHVRAIDLPGLGDDTADADKVTVGDWADRVAAAACGHAEPALIVGHSLGGVAIAQAAERTPENVLGLAFLTALMLDDGQTVRAACADMLAHAQEVIACHPGDTDTAMMKLLYGSCPADLAAAAIARLRPQPPRIMETPMQLSPERFGRLPRAYIECSEDGVVPLAVQRRMQASLPCDPVVTMASDHSPFLGQPAQLAGHIDDIARLYGARARADRAKTRRGRLVAGGAAA